MSDLLQAVESKILSVTMGISLLLGLSKIVFSELDRVLVLFDWVWRRVRIFPFNQPAKSNGPPRLGEYALFFFLSKKDRINIPGDLEEEYREIEATFGTRAARIWYYKQVITSVGPLFRKGCLRWISIAWVEERVRRHL